MEKSEKIIIALVVMVGLIGIFFLGRTENDVNQEVLSQSAKTSEELMNEVLNKNYSNLSVENYKIFEEVKSPDSTKSAVLFGLDIEKTNECCSKPTGIFINNQGKLGATYDILQGSLQHMSLENAIWQNEKTVLYDLIISDEGGDQSTQKSIELIN